MARFIFVLTIVYLQWVDGMASAHRFVLLNGCRCSHCYRIRLYSVKSFKLLGTLDYHKNGCYALSFSNLNPDLKQKPGQGEDEDEDEIEGRNLWLASGGKDSRLCIWQLMSFTK